MSTLPRVHPARGLAAPVRPRHVMALSLFPHTHYAGTRREMLDALMRKYSGCYHSVGGDRNRFGVTLWRVSSLHDLAVRLCHIEDHSLEMLDIVGHGVPGALVVGTRPGDGFLTGRERGDTLDAQSISRLEIVARKLEHPRHGCPEPCLRLIGCNVGAEPVGHRPDLVEELARALRVTVKATTTMLGYRDFPDSPADLDTALSWRAARPDAPRLVQSRSGVQQGSNG